MHYQEGVRWESESAKSREFRERFVSVLGRDMALCDWQVRLCEGLLARDTDGGFLETMEPRQGEEQLDVPGKAMLVILDYDADPRGEILWPSDGSWLNFQVPAWKTWQFVYVEADGRGFAYRVGPGLPRIKWDHMIDGVRWEKVSDPPKPTVANADTITINMGSIQPLLDPTRINTVVSKAQKDENMLHVSTARTIDGYVAQIVTRDRAGGPDRIVWQSAKAYKSDAKAAKAADKRIVYVLSRLASVGVQ